MVFVCTALQEACSRAVSRSAMALHVEPALCLDTVAVSDQMLECQCSPAVG